MRRSVLHRWLLKHFRFRVFHELSFARLRPLHSYLFHRVLLSRQSTMLSTTRPISRCTIWSELRIRSVTPPLEPTGRFLFRYQCTTLIWRVLERAVTSNDMRQRIPRDLGPHLNHHRKAVIKCLLHCIWYHFFLDVAESCDVALLL